MIGQYKLYDHIDELPFNRFLDCYCDGNLQALIIEGEAPRQILIETWDNIFCQCIDANGDTEAIYIIELKKDIALLEYKVKLTECAIANLKIVFSKALLDLLKSVGIRTNGIDPEKDDYQIRLKKIVAMLAPRKFQLTEMINELNAYEKRFENKTIDRQIFKTMLIRLSKFQGYPVRANEIVVSEYYAILREYVLSNSKQKIDQDGEEG